MEVSTARPYRSKKQRPCDRCRARKTSCIIIETTPCQSCLRTRSSCTFNSRPTRRKQRQSTLAPSTSPASLDVTHRLTALPEADLFPDLGRSRATRDQDDIQSLSQRHRERAQEHQPRARPQNLDTLNYERDIGDNVSTFPVFTGVSDAPTVQYIRSVDREEGSAAQLLGTSAESDPWLLRHCRYDDYGMCDLPRVRFRNVGGVPAERLVPVQFLVVDDSLLKQAKRETAIGPQAGQQALYQKLDGLLSPSDGQRLIALFMRFVFPLMPVISRSELQLSLMDISSFAVPVHLLAAIYASALPFRAHDPSLCVSSAYENPPITELWRLVYELVMQEIHTPKLAVLQAALLYLQRFPSGAESAVSDSPFVWSFFGIVANLASTLGLHLECRNWGIPPWEKRLRRRLWWVLFVEDKWRSLLTGRPPMIRPEEWDVSALDDEDFEVDSLPYPTPSNCHSSNEWDDGKSFMILSKLALVADALQATFFSLRASQKLYEDFRASIDAAKSIRQDLQAWCSALPQTLRLRSLSENATYSTKDRPQGAAVLHLSYLVLEMLLYRAILRPLARSPPPPMISREGDIEVEMGYNDLQELFSVLDFDHLNGLPVLDTVEVGEAAEIAVNAAEKCAAIVVNFVNGLTSRDFDGFWHSWARLCIPMITNFILLLSVQAPSVQHAVRSKQLFDMWSHSLTYQFKNHKDLLRLGLVRLNSWQVGGLERHFFLPSHVAGLWQVDELGSRFNAEGNSSL